MTRTPTTIALSSWLLLVSSAAAQSSARSADLQQQRLVAPGSIGGNPFMPARRGEFRSPTALGGYCIVMLRDQQQWVAGQEQVQQIFDGKIYRFAGPRQREVFVAAPTRYVPALGGDCAVTYVETGRRRPGYPQYGLLHDRRLYFFAGRDQQQAFRAAPQRYADADLADEGLCLVSRVDHERQMPGLPETTVVVDGFRYQFAGAHERARFANNMLRYGVARTAVMQREGQRRVSPPQLLLPGEIPLPLGEQKSAGDAKLLSEPDDDFDAGSVAMEGYCAVSILQQGVWVRGLRKYATPFAGKVFRFAGEEEKARFLENPDEYFPALAGDCVVSKVDTGRRVPGSVFHPVTYEGRLYLFAGPDQKETFRVEPVTYANADSAAGGSCVVTRTEEGKVVPGLAEYVAWHRGMRYFFASGTQRAKFIAEPERYTRVSTSIDDLE